MAPAILRHKYCLPMHHKIHGSHGYSRGYNVNYDTILQVCRHLSGFGIWFGLLSLFMILVTAGLLWVQQMIASAERSRGDLRAGL